MMKPTFLESSEVYDFDVLQGEYGIENLDDILQDWGISVFHRQDDGPRLVWADEWRRFVRGVVRRNFELIEELRIAVPAGSVFQSNWNRRRQRLLDRNPSLKTLTESFISAVTEQMEGVMVKRNASTITLLLPERKLKTGIRLRKRGLRLVSTRDKEQREFWVESPDDFIAGVLFVGGGFSGDRARKTLTDVIRLVEQRE